MEITQHLGSVLAALLRRIRQWPELERLLARLAGHFTTWPADEFARFTRTPITRSGTDPGPWFETRQEQPEVAEEADPAARVALPPRTVVTQPRREPAMAPSAFERRFARLHREGRYDDMWVMLADDARLSWGSPAAFAERMRDQSGNVELLDADVHDVDIVPEWTDSRANRTYRNVARLAVSYRVRDQEREWTLRRQVHLVPFGDGWRTLWYPQPETGS